MFLLQVELVSSKMRELTTTDIQTGIIGDPVFDTFYASQVQFQNDTVYQILTSTHPH